MNAQNDVTILSTEAREAIKVRLPKLVESGDIETAMTAIREKYGFMPSPEYVRDLIVFVEELTREPRD